MTDWETIGIIGLILPVDAVLVSYLMAWWLRRYIKGLWAEKEKQQKKKWWPW